MTEDAETLVIPSQKEDQERVQLNSIVFYLRKACPFGHQVYKFVDKKWFEHLIDTVSKCEVVFATQYVFGWLGFVW